MTEQPADDTVAELIPITVTCRTDDCTNQDIGIDADAGTITDLWVVCGACGNPIDDIQTRQEKDE